MLTKILYFVQNISFNNIYLLICWQSKFCKKFFTHTLARKGTQSHQNWTFAQSVANSVLFISILTYQMYGAKLSGCQIVRFYNLCAKLSAFIILVPNCPLYYLGAKLSGAKLSGAKLAGAKLSYNLPKDQLKVQNSRRKKENFDFIHSFVFSTRKNYQPNQLLKCFCT